MLAAGVALDVFTLDMPDLTQRILAGALVVMGLLSAVAAWLRWALAERAMRRSRPLPSFGFGAVLTLAMVVTVLVLVAVGL